MLGVVGGRLSLKKWRGHVCRDNKASKLFKNADTRLIYATVRYLRLISKRYFHGYFPYTTIPCFA